MKKVNLLSRAEMKNVMGGIIYGDTLYQTYLKWLCSLEDVDSSSHKYDVINEM